MSVGEPELCQSVQKYVHHSSQRGSKRFIWLIWWSTFGQKDNLLTNMFYQRDLLSIFPLKQTWSLHFLFRGGQANRGAGETWLVKCICYNQHFAQFLTFSRATNGSALILNLLCLAQTPRGMQTVEIYYWQAENSQLPPSKCARTPPQRKQDDIWGKALRGFKVRREPIMIDNDMKVGKRLKGSSKNV